MTLPFTQGCHAGLLEQVERLVNQLDMLYASLAADSRVKHVTGGSPA